MYLDRPSDSQTPTNKQTDILNFRFLALIRLLHILTSVKSTDLLHCQLKVNVENWESNSDLVWNDLHVGLQADLQMNDVHEIL